MVSHLFGVNLADQLLTLRDDTWWEVKAQLLIVCMTVLDLLDPVVRNCDRCIVLNALAERATCFKGARPAQRWHPRERVHHCSTFLCDSGGKRTVLDYCGISVREKYWRCRCRLR